MEHELTGLVQQANIVNLNYIVAKTSNEELGNLDVAIKQLEARVAQMRASLQEEASILLATSDAVSQILAKVKGKPLPSALKGARHSPPVVALTPNKMTPGRKAVSFDIKSSPLSLVQAANSEIELGTFNGVTTSVARLTLAEFEQIPKYMKGRLTIDKLSLMVDLLNQLYAEKYAIMSQNPSKLPHEHRQKYWDWKELDCEEVQERYFITEADIKNVMQNSVAKQSPSATFKLDPLGRSVLAILRHFGRIREIRTPGVVRFVIL